MIIKKLTILLAVSALLLCSCGNSAVSIPSGSSFASQSISESSSISQTEKNSKSSSADNQQEKTASGVIDDLSMNQIWMTLENGNQINFVSDNIDFSEIDSYKPGEKVTIHYKGDLDGDFTVTKLTP